MERKALVIGGGPAGLSSALGLLRSGFSVTVVEQRSEWQGRVCGAFLNPEAVGHLRWLNVLEEARASGAVPVTSATLTFPSGARRRISTTQQGETALALPRRELEEILTAAVRGAGGKVETGVRAKAPSPTPPGELRVLADGRFSIGTAVEKKREAGWYGWNAAFQNVRQNAGDLSLHFYPGGYVGVLTFSDGQTNVCGLVHKRSGEPVSWEKIFEEALLRQPCFREALRGAQRTAEWRGVGPLLFSIRMRQSAGALLAGDAAAVGDPFMGEGIGRALGAGPLIFESLRSGLTEAPGTYAVLWKRRYAARLKIGRAFRWLQERPSLFHPALRLLLRAPRVIDRVTPYFHGGIFVKADTRYDGNAHGTRSPKDLSHT